MAGFTKKQLDAPIRVCHRLQSLRESTGLTIEDLAYRTKLQAEYIEALETCKFDRLPHELVYQKLFLKRYLAGLDVDPTPYLAQFVNEEAAVPEQTIPKKPTTRSKWLKRPPTLVPLVGMVTAGMMFFAYLGMHVHSLYQPPSLKLTTPEDGMINQEGVTTIAGTTDPEVSVFINGQQVRSDETGSFETDIDLQPGVNTILVSAKKRHGSESNITKYVLYRETSQVSYTPTDAQLTTN